MFKYITYLRVLFNHEGSTSVILDFLKNLLAVILSLVLRVEDLWHGLEPQPLKGFPGVETRGLSFYCLERKKIYEKNVQLYATKNYKISIKVFNVLCIQVKPLTGLIFSAGPCPVQTSSASCPWWPSWCRTWCSPPPAQTWVRFSCSTEAHLNPICRREKAVR